MMRSSSTRRFSLIEFIVVILVLAVLLILVPPLQHHHGHRNGKMRCANNLKGVTIGFILYSDEYKFFPHMRAHEEEHSGEDISRVYRSLIHLKYVDNAEAYICPSSEDFYIQPEDTVIEDPRLFQWGKAEPLESAKLPLLSDAEPDVFENEHLSYTYRRKLLAFDRARSDTIVAADKALRDALDDGSAKPPYGNHTEGFNFAFADGHVQFYPIEDLQRMTALQETALMHPRFEALTADDVGELEEEAK